MMTGGLLGGTSSAVAAACLAWYAILVG